MKKPSDRIVRAVADALNQATHKNVAEHMAAGFLWACYPEWFEKIYPILKPYEKERSGRTGWK